MLIDDLGHSACVAGVAHGIAALVTCACVAGVARGASKATKSVC